MVDTQSFYDFLIRNGLDFFAGVPDSLLKDFCSCVTNHSDPKHNIIAANEGNAVALCAGYHLATGKIGIVYMQNSGEGNAVNPLLSLADPKVYSVPMLLIIGWRGEPGVHDEPQHVKQGEVTLRLLEAMDIPYLVLGEDYENDLAKMVSIAKKESRPVAVVVKKGTFSPCKLMKKPSPAGILTREQALSVLVAKTGSDPIVSTTGKESRELFELREKNGEGHDFDFLTVGSMGHTSSIALGISLATDKTVWCFDGDGSFIMHMGALAIVGSHGGSNFKYILNNNSAHESVGGQPTVGSLIDIPMILKGCGFEVVHEARTEQEIVLAMDLMRNEGKSALVIYTKQGSRDDLGRPTTTPIENKLAFMKHLRES